MTDHIYVPMWRESKHDIGRMNPIYLLDREQIVKSTERNRFALQSGSSRLAIRMLEVVFLFGKTGERMETKALFPSRFGFIERMIGGFIELLIGEPG